MKTGKELAEEHWTYVKKILELHGTDKKSIELIGFHYNAAFIHGYKHAKEYYD
jgi:hypothetical protein